MLKTILLVRVVVGVSVSLALSLDGIAPIRCAEHPPLLRCRRHPCAPRRRRLVLPPPHKKKARAVAVGNKSLYLSRRNPARLYSPKDREEQPNPPAHAIPNLRTKKQSSFRHNRPSFLPPTSFPSFPLFATPERPPAKGRRMYGNGGGGRRKERKVSLLFREPAQDGKVRADEEREHADAKERRERGRVLVRESRGPPFPPSPRAPLSYNTAPARPTTQ